MSLSRLKTWVAGEVLTASDLNSEINNIINNSLSLVSPFSGTVDLDGQELIFDADADSSLTADINNELDLKLGGSDIFRWKTVASAVNGIDFFGSATGTEVYSVPFGNDTNISHGVRGKGTGSVILGQATSLGVQLAVDQPITDSSGNEFLKFSKTASAVNELTVTNQATGIPPTLSATGGDTDIDLNLISKGSGVVKLNGVPAITGFDISNVAVGTITFNAGAMTIPLKGDNGNDHSSTNVGSIKFRNATQETGTPTILNITSATTLVISAGSTLGTTSAALSQLVLVGFNDAGTFRLGVANISGLLINDDVLASSTAEGGAGAADSAAVYYTSVAVSSKPIKVLALLESTQTTAGTWAQSFSKIQLGKAWLLPPVTYTDQTNSLTSVLASGNIYGLILTNDPGDTANDIAVSAGAAADSTNALSMTLPSAITKRLDATWAVGTNQGGLDTGTRAVSTWYHIWLIQRQDTGVVDVLFSTSVSAPTMPTNYSRKRRIGSVLSLAGNTNAQFFQNGDEFFFLTPSVDVNTALSVTTAVTRTLTTPLGVRVRALVFASRTATNTGVAGLYLSSLDTTDVASSATVDSFRAEFTGTAAIGQQVHVWTNTSSQIRSRADNVSNDTIVISTLGWLDTRGKLT